jgi:hypothetical protein
VSIPAILLPLFVQVALTFALLMWTGSRRLRAVRSGEVHPREVSMGERCWPGPVQQVSNAFCNQFEIPVLFYLLVIMALLTRKADLLFVVLSWAFVLSRFAHAAVYVTTNHVPHRFAAFLAGVLVLMVMWTVFAVRILSGPWPA